MGKKKTKSKTKVYASISSNKKPSAHTSCWQSIFVSIMPLTIVMLAFAANLVFLWSFDPALAETYAAHLEPVLFAVSVYQRI